MTQVAGAVNLPRGAPLARYLQAASTKRAASRPGPGTLGAMPMNEEE
jgi:hypothetical protein